ncbi:MAG: hypothetical protein AAGJ82_02840 [Bacteroidota bacterium]
MYVNPLRLLNISTVDPAAVRKAKNQQLALLQLSDDGTLSYGNLAVDRSVFLAACDELKDERKAKYHLELFEQVHLLDFLSFGETTFFDQYEPRDLWEDPSFRRFVGPHYLQQYDQVYARAFTSGDVYLMRKMMEVDPLLSPSLTNNLYQTTVRKAEVEKTDLANYQQRLRYARPGTLPDNAVAFWAALQEVSAMEAWQALPAAFTPIRSEVARIYSSLLDHMQKLFPAEETVVEGYWEALSQLTVDASTRLALVEHRQSFIKRQAQREQQQTQYKRQQTLRLVKQVNRLLQRYQQGEITAEVLVAGLRAIREEAGFQEKKANLRTGDFRQMGKKLAALAVLLWEKHQDWRAVQSVLDMVVLFHIPDQPYAFFDSPAAAANTTEGAAFRAVVLLGALRTLVNKNRRFEGAQPHLLTWSSLIKQLFTDQIQQWLLDSGGSSLLAWTQEQIFPLLYFLRRSAPEATLALLDHLHPLLHNDKVMGQKADELRREIADDLAKTRRQEERRAAVADSPWGSVRQQWDDWSRQAEELDVMQWVRIGGAVLFTLLIAGFCYSYVFVQKQPPTVDPTIAIAKPSVSDIELEDEDFVVQRDSFAGNQLDNYALAFPLCFEEGVYGGSGTFRIYNRTSEDMVACLYMRDSVVVRHYYIQEDSRVDFQRLPNDTLRLKVYMGHDWNPLKPNFCGTDGAFDSEPQYWWYQPKLTPAVLRSSMSLVIQDEKVSTLPGFDVYPFEERFLRISAQGFFYIKSDWKKRRDGEFDN